MKPLSNLFYVTGMIRADFQNEPSGEALSETSDPRGDLKAPPQIPGPPTERRPGIVETENRQRKANLAVEALLALADGEGPLEGGVDRVLGRGLAHVSGHRDDARIVRPKGHAGLGRQERNKYFFEVFFKHGVVKCD